MISIKQVLISLALIAVILLSGCVGNEKPKKVTTSTIKETTTIPTTSTTSTTTATTTTITTTTTKIPPSTTIKFTGATLVYKPDEPPSGAYLLKDVSSGNFNAEYRGYRFRIDHVTRHGYDVSKVLFDIEKPDGTPIPAQLGWSECHNDFYDIQVDNLVIRLWSVRYEKQETIQTAEIYVWDFNEHPVMKTLDLDPKPPHPDAELIMDVTNEGFTAEYEGYKFRIDRLIYDEEYYISGMVLDVQKPDGSIVQATITKRSTAKVDDLNIASPFCGYVEEAAPSLVGAIYVWKS